MTKKLIVSSIILSILFICGCLFGIPKTILKAAEPSDPDYWQRFNSWYTFNSDPIVSSNLGYDNDDFIVKGMTKSFFDFSVSGYTATTNTLYSIYIYQNELIYRFTLVDPQWGIVDYWDEIVYANGEWVNDEYRYIYIEQVQATSSDQLIYLDWLNANGIFEYVYTPVQSDAKDLIYTIVDIIPHTMQSLTSFQIFNTTLFIIIGSLIVIILIFKLTKGGGLF